MIFEKLEYWSQFDLPVIKIEDYNYIPVSQVNNILNLVELKTGSNIYRSDCTKLINSVTRSENNVIKNQSLELFVPIELLSTFIITKNS